MCFQKHAAHAVSDTLVVTLNTQTQMEQAHPHPADQEEGLFSWKCTRVHNMDPSCYLP